MRFPALMTLAINRAPASERGSVVGTFTAFFDLSFGVGAASAGQIAAMVGYRGAFVAAAVSSADGDRPSRFVMRGGAPRRIGAVAGSEAA